MSLNLQPFARIHRERKGVPPLALIASDRKLVVEQVHCYDRKATRRVLPVNRFQYRFFQSARRTVDPPEIQQHNIPAQRRQTETASLQVPKRKIVRRDRAGIEIEAESRERFRGNRPRGQSGQDQRGENQSKDQATVSRHELSFRLGDKYRRMLQYSHGYFNDFLAKKVTCFF
jgi:hypothetical protein